VLPPLSRCLKLETASDRSGAACAYDCRTAGGRNWRRAGLGAVFERTVVRIPPPALKDGWIQAPLTQPNVLTCDGGGAAVAAEYGLSRCHTPCGQGCLTHGSSQRDPGEHREWQLIEVDPRSVSRYSWRTGHRRTARDEDPVFHEASKPARQKLGAMRGLLEVVESAGPKKALNSRWSMSPMTPRLADRTRSVRSSRDRLGCASLAKAGEREGPGLQA